MHNPSSGPCEDGMTRLAQSDTLSIAALADPSCYRAAFQAGLRPDPDEPIDEWADAHVHLPSHVAEHGPWRTSRTPFLREIMQCLSPQHPSHEVVFIKPTQIGGTQVAINWAGYVIDRAPTVMMLTEPTRDFAKKLSDEKLQPMLDCTPCLQGKVRDARERDSGNTILKKKFLGGFLVLAGVNSSIGMRFTSVKYIVMDEVDEYPADVGDQGHPCDILAKRAATFPGYKLFKLSSPATADLSRIEPDYRKGSRGQYQVPCPFCGQQQALHWGNLVFTFDGLADPERAAYRCAGCLALIPERYKTWMMDTARAQWVHEDPDNPIRSFHLNLLYQPYGWAYPWSRLAFDWLEANAEAKAGDTRKLKTFINTVLAETWEEKGEKADDHALYQRREVYEAACPSGVLVLTAAIDVQDNRLEVEIDGWGVDEENWSIEKRVFPGSPAQPTVWKDVTEWLQRTRRHAYGGTLRVECVVVDTGGHHTKEAYWFVRRYRGRCYALKGSNQQGAPLVPPRPTRPRGAAVHLYHVGTVAAKDTIFSRLKLSVPGPGYMHFPVKDEYDEECFAQLAAEEKRHKYDRGVMTGYHYKKIRARNEELDLKVYNLAAVALLNPNWERLAAKVERQPQIELAVDEETGEAVEPESRAPREPVGVAASAAPAPPVPAASQAKPTFIKKRLPPRRGGGFVQGWR